jgi:predicted Zn-dependent peptidase
VHADAPALDLLSTVMNGRSGRLYKTLVLDKKLALNASSNFEGRKYGGILSVAASPKPDADFAEVEKELLAAVERLRKEPVAENELQRARQQMTADLIRDLDTNNGIATHLGFAEIQDTWKDLFNQIPDLNKVTLEDLQRVARTYYTPEGRNVLVIKRKGTGK